MASNTFMRVDEVAETLGISKSYAYKIVQKLNAELKEKYETLEITYNEKLQEEKQKIKDKYEDRIYNLEKENNFLKKVITTLQQTVEKFIHWICRKFSVSEEDELIRDFEFENDTYIGGIHPWIISTAWMGKYYQMTNNDDYLVILL